MKIQDLNEKWSKKYKRSIDCDHPKGFSQRAHCQGRSKKEEAVQPVTPAAKPNQHGYKSHSPLKNKTNSKTSRTFADVLNAVNKKPPMTESILVTDVPNEDWLKNKVDYAKSHGRDSFGVPYMGSTTGYVRQPSYVELPVDLLARIPGARSEQSRVRYDDLLAITKIMHDTGKLPLDRNGEEYKPFITVAWDGSAWVSEGNHRIMAARRLGWKTLPVELKYFDGGERIKSGMLYPDKIGLTTPHPGSKVVMNLESEFVAELTGQPYPYRYVGREKSPDGDIEFWFYSDEADLELVYVMADNVLSVVFRVEGTTELTGRQGMMKALRILATVEKILKESLDDIILNTDPDTVMFTARSSEPKRIKFYNSIAPKFGAILGPMWQQQPLTYFQGGVGWSWKRRRNKVYEGEDSLQHQLKRQQLIRKLSKMDPGLELNVLELATMQELQTINAMITRSHQAPIQNDGAPKVYLDMDGVLADFNKGYRDRFGRDPDISARDDPNVGKLVGTDFFSTLPKLPEADALIQACVQLFGGYSICSSPLRGDHSNSATNKKHWISEHLSPPPDNVVITGKKDSYAKGKNILIDDKIKNIIPWRQRGGIGILYDAYTDDVSDVIAQLKQIADQSSLIVKEISTLPANRFTGLSYLKDYQKDYADLHRISLPLPGGSGYRFAIAPGNTRYFILHPLKFRVIGMLELTPSKKFPLQPAYGVNAIVVDPKYQGKGIAKSLYGIALAIMKVTLLSGSVQTPGGQRNWLSLYNIPGVEVRGYVSIFDREISSGSGAIEKFKTWNIHGDMDPDELSQTADQNIDLLMGRIGAEYIGVAPGTDLHYFAFDVSPDPVKQRLAAQEITKYTVLYGHSLRDIGLYAKWHGAD